MGYTEADVPDLTGRTALVTGATSGVGLQVATVLAGRGARVFVAYRDAERGDRALRTIREAAPAADVRLVELDLARLGSVRRGAAEVAAQAPQLDLLFANAGIMATPYAVTADGFEAQFGTNHLGHFALTGLVLPALLAAPAARVVVTSSVAHHPGRVGFDDLMFQRRPYERWPAYSQSKLANLLFAFELQRRLAAAGSPAQALGAHPGYVATNLQLGPFRGRLPALEPLVQPLYQFVNRTLGEKPQAGARPLLMAAFGPGSRGGDHFGPSGPNESRGAPGPARVAPAARDEDVARRLWTVSEELTGVHYTALAPAV
ncbi:hypothetical protein BJF78_23120 [Pseudonocardia sp. CNS-139]|nr:hypothetical protein BJF78_23120 [Pseudonocardia sp. CNS-139]